MWSIFFCGYHNVNLHTSIIYIDNLLFIIFLYLCKCNRRLVKSQLFICNKLFHFAEARIIRHKNRGQQWERLERIPYQKEKYGLRKTLASGFVQQLSLSVPAAAEDLGPLVEGGGGGGEHDEVFLLQTQSAHSRCGVEAARPREATASKKYKKTKRSSPCKWVGEPD